MLNRLMKPLLYLLSVFLLALGCQFKDSLVLIVGEKKVVNRFFGEGHTVDNIVTIKQTYPHLEHIIPGHGKVGNITLLDYTIDLFNPEQ